MLKALLKTMRPRQWTKNAFVLAALVFDQQLTHLPALGKTLAAFVLFCVLSGSIYIINDIFDVVADRNHPKKRLRPIAAGILPIPVAITAAVLFAGITLPVSYLLSPAFTLILLAYFVTNLAYSKWLKHIPIIDVLVLASGFVLRVAAGVSVINVQRFSPWLYVCMTLLALYIGFGKRRAELTQLDGQSDQRRVLEGYTLPFLDQIITIVSSTTIIAYSLYTFSAPNVPANHTMMLTIPFVLYAIFRYLYLVQVKQEGSAPEELVLTDRPLQVTVLLWGAAVVGVFYLH
jgi:4-hydroxybenzoate polyprenyltransferase